MEIVFSIATLVGGVAALWYFWDKIVAFIGGRDGVSEHDLALYDRYKALFVDNGVAEFYRQHDFLGSFDDSLWRPLSSYVDNWHTVEHEFVNKRLCAASKKVYDAAYELGMTIAQYTVPIGQDGRMRSVKSDRAPNDPTPERIKREAQEINALTPAFVEAHNQFIRLANSMLYNKIS